jgi:hypothetical protein
MRIQREIKQVETFFCLGSTVTTKGGADEDVKNRIKKANEAFIQLYPIWRNKYISKKTKVRIFSTNVKSVLIYTCVRQRVAKQITDMLEFY